MIKTFEGRQCRYTDEQLIDFLQERNDDAIYSGKCILRFSLHGRGWRLHETTLEGAYASVREAIEYVMDEYYQREEVDF